jgi:hypothetical protein
VEGEKHHHTTDLICFAEATDHTQITAGDGVCAKLLVQMLVRGVRARYHQQTRSEPIDAMHYALHTPTPTFIHSDANTSQVNINALSTPSIIRTSKNECKYRSHSQRIGFGRAQALRASTHVQ